MYYRPDEKAACGDVIPFYKDGTWYLFYLKDFRDIENCGEGVPWCLVTTQDLVHYTDHGEVIPRGTKDEQDLYVFTGSCIEANGKYYIFYTGHNHLTPILERVLLAESDDLYHWRKCPDFVLDAPEWAATRDFRDPFVFENPEGSGWCMLTTTQMQGADGLPVSANLIAYSDDLLHWSFPDKPFYTPSAYTSPPECADLFRIGDWWYLLFSEYSDRLVTCYRMSKSPFGPWITPTDDSLDGAIYYAAKSASDGRQRILFGWNRTKADNTDKGIYQWGGTIVPHELAQNPDGTLRVGCPSQIAAQYTVPQSLQEDAPAKNHVVKTDCGWRIGAPESRSTKLLGALPRYCRLELDFTSTDKNGCFGLLLRTEKGEPGYALRFEPRFEQLVFWDGVPNHFESQRWCPLMPGETHHLTVIVEDSVLEAYIDGATAQSSRMYDHTGANWGLFAINTTVDFANIELYTLPEN